MGDAVRAAITTGLPPGLWDDLRQAFEPRFELRGMLGRGGMGVVIEAYDPILERPLAIKIVSPDALSYDPTARERLLREARAAATLSHPNVVSVFGVGETPTLRAPYILMQRVMGETLEHKEAGKAPVEVHTAMRILGDVAEALTAAHARGLVHRDLKPSNVMLDRETGRAVVLDFGISHFAPTPGRQEAKLTGTGMYVGTPLYMSPEQAMGAPVTDKSDIYSLGCLMYEVLTGRRVFEGESAMVVMASHIKDVPVPIGRVRPGIPPVLNDAVMACLEKDPARRPTADEIRRRCAVLPAHHPWVSAGARTASARLRTVGWLGVCGGLLMTAQIGMLASGGITLGGLQYIVPAFGVALAILYLVALVRAFSAARAVGWRPRAIALLAGERNIDIRALVERLQEMAVANDAERARLIRHAIRNGAAFLLAGPASLVLAVAVTLTPLAEVLPISYAAALSAAPLIVWLALEMNGRFNTRTPGAAGSLRTGEGSQEGETAVLRDWLDRNGGIFAGRAGASGRRVIRAGAWLLGGGMLCLAAGFLGVQVAIGNLSHPQLSTFGAKYAVARPYFAAARFPFPYIPDRSAGREAWRVINGGADSAQVTTQRALAGFDSVAPAEWKRFPGGLGAGTMEAAFHGFTPAQVRSLEVVASTSAIRLIRSAVRGGAPPYWDDRAAGPLSNEDSSIADAGVPKFSVGKDAVTLLTLQAALMVHKGRRDSAEVLLGEGLAFAYLEERQAHTMIETLIASVEAGIIGRSLAVYYEHSNQLDKLQSLSPMGQLPSGADLLDLASEVAPDSTGGAYKWLHDSAASPGLRWEGVLLERRLSCNRARALWTDRDEQFDSAAAYARRALARTRTDSIILDAIVRDLSVRGERSDPLTDPDRSAWREWWRRVAHAAGKRTLAGCLSLGPYD